MLWVLGGRGRRRGRGRGHAAEAYKAPFKFTGKINKVTIDLKEMRGADKAEADKAHREAAHKKALSD